MDRIEERYLLEELVDNLNQEAEPLEFGIEMIEKQLEAFSGIHAFFEADSVIQDQLQEQLRLWGSHFAFNPNT